MIKDLNRAIKKLSEYRDNLLRELNSLDHILECSIENYDFMIDFAIVNGFKRVVDIGCAYGHQSELCKDRIRYYGIDKSALNFYYNDKKTKKCIYESEKYPFYIPFDLFKDDLAISNLCIGWNCYTDNEEELRNQFKALKKDFKASLLYMPREREKALREIFQSVKIIKDEPKGPVPTAFYYCY